jgi:DivIVA domain-containing protein
MTRRTDVRLRHRHNDPVGDHRGFPVVVRGYDVDEVDAVLERIRKAAASTDGAFRASVREELNQPALHVRLRGYDRAEVDDYLRRAVDRLA